MTTLRSNADFPEHLDENRRIWDANARWWDDRIGDGNDFQTLLIEPATERLLNVTAGDTILDVACGAGRFARCMASLGAKVVGIDTSREFIARARERSGLRAIALADSEEIGPDDLPIGNGAASPAEVSAEDLAQLGARRELTLRELEDLYIDAILRRTGGNKVRAAHLLGIDRKTLYRRAERRTRTAIKE